MQGPCVWGQDSYSHQRRFPCSFIAPRLPCLHYSRDPSPPCPLQNFLSRAPKCPLQTQDHSHQCLSYLHSPLHHTALCCWCLLLRFHRAVLHGILLLFRDAHGIADHLPMSRNYRLPEKWGSPGIPALMGLPCCCPALFLVLTKSLLGII